MLLSNGLVAVWLARAAQAIIGLDWRVSNRVALSLTLLWLLLPWGTSSQFWTVLLPVELAVALFAYLITRICDRKSPTFAGSLIDGLIYLFMCVTYEAFYGQLVAVVILCIALVVFGRMRPPAVVFNLMSLGTAQALAIGWYFASAKVTTAQKGIITSWTTLLRQNLARTVPEMMISTSETGWALCLGLLALLACAGWVLWRSRRRWAGGRQILGSTLIALACVLGAAVSVVSFSLGGRIVTGLGLTNRTFLLVNFWLVLLVAIVALAVLRLAGTGELKVLGWFGLACGVIVGAGHTVRALDWAGAWTQQQEILRSAPLEQLQAVEADAAVVIVNPLDVNGAPIFAAPWDINNALPLTYRTLKKRTITVYSHWGGPMVWDGNRLAYAGEALLVATRHVYLWIPADRSFRRADRPFQIGTDLSIRDLP